MRFQQSGAEGGKGLQGLFQGHFCAVCASLTSGFRLTPGLANDTVMGFDHRIGNCAAPFDGADRENS